MKSTILYLSGHSSLCFYHLTTSHHHVVGCSDVCVHMLLRLFVYVSFQKECELLQGREYLSSSLGHGRIPESNAQSILMKELPYVEITFFFIKDGIIKTVHF